VKADRYPKKGVLSAINGERSNRRISREEVRNCHGPLGDFTVICTRLRFVTRRAHKGEHKNSTPTKTGYA